ncbi:hypothetical protein CI109_106278 [Kwoniella shandongensis]|uniref:Uncharacterized protein n=1 Tax=Kwoniella shandongensis TaxID=1734106 RepID=A0A5M6BSC3_9TREE|nr:uncharacterized protein CI109_006722 [Kwoniella shandongensis]KAA5524922.1 hypothetical protein CI109_006722 [Kwoniella shandongensis]
MSRGGFRGRGRGGGPGGMPPGGFGNNQEWTDALNRMRTMPKYSSNMLYPPLENTNKSYLPEPTPHESLIMSHTISLATTLVDGKAPGEVSSSSAQNEIPPWRIAGERKVVGIEIESYSDRFNSPSSSAGPSKIDPVALHMDQNYFPPALWTEYFDGSADKPKAKLKKKRKVDDLDKDDGDDKADDEESQASSAEEDFDFDDDDSDHQDYDANYFDNGEGDDDEGGDEEGGDAYED